MAIQGHVFGILGKPTIDSIPLYYIVGLISKGSEDIASEITENSRFRQPYYRLTLPVNGTPRISA